MHVLHPRILEAERQAKTLKDYAIRPRSPLTARQRWELVFQLPNGKPVLIGRFDAREDAEEYLMAKLPAIESEL